MPRGNGGIVGPVNTSFSGVWSLTEAQLRRSANTWPNFYSSLLSESATGSDAFAAADNADPYFEYTTLLLPGNGTNGAQNNTFLDGSTNNFTITRNGNTTQGTFSPFSQTGWGNYFGSVSDYLNVTSTSLSSSFTIEFFVFFNSAPSALNIIFSNAAGGGGNNWIGITSTTVSFSYSGTTRTFSFTPSGGTWYYVQIINSASSLSCYVNGSQIGTTQTGPSSYSIDRIGGYTGSGFSGYLSNVRVNSTALAVSATPTSPLTAVANTVLLTCQANRFVDSNTQTTPKTITPSGSPSVQAFSPFNPTASWSAATNGGSGYLDGNGDYLTVADNAAFAFGTDSFTIEMWVYATGLGATRRLYYQQTIGSGGSTQVGIYQLNTNYIGFYSNTSGTTIVDILSNTAITANTWTHIAVVRNGNNFNLYQNGVSVGTASTASSLPDPNGLLYIGAIDPSGQEWLGYISNFRVIKGTAVYTGAFTPPSLIPLTTAGSTSAAAYPSTTNVNTSFASSATSLLLTFTNAGIYDATSKNDLETVGNAQISTAISAKWGSGSMAFDGNGDYLLGPAAKVNDFGTGDFTIEAWIYFSSVANGQIASAGGGPVSGAYYWQFYTSQLQFGANTSPGQLIAANWSPSSGVWYHVAVTRSGTTLRQFVNGTQLGTNATSSHSFVDASTQIGYGGAGYFNGYLQDLRVTKGYARYTANFTAPTAAFPTL